MSQAKTTVTLFRPVGQKELDLITESGWKRFPPRLSSQPIFYPVLSEEYAIRNARDWNTKDRNSGFVGYVVSFQVDKDYADRLDPHEAGGRACIEYWIPAEQIDEFNNHIIGPIRLIHEFRSQAESGTDP